MDICVQILNLNRQTTTADKIYWNKIECLDSDRHIHIWELPKSLKMKTNNHKSPNRDEIY